jgi:hypothetical protein
MRAFTIEECGRFPLTQCSGVKLFFFGCGDLSPETSTWGRDDRNSSSVLPLSLHF